MSVVTLANIVEKLLSRNWQSTFKSDGFISSNDIIAFSSTVVMVCVLPCEFKSASVRNRSSHSVQSYFRSLLTPSFRNLISPVDLWAFWHVDTGLLCYILCSTTYTDISWSYEWDYVLLCFALLQSHCTTCTPPYLRLHQLIYPFGMSKLCSVPPNFSFPSNSSAQNKQG